MNRQTKKITNNKKYKLPRIEHEDHVKFITRKTSKSALWFLNNPQLIESIHSYLALYCEKHQVELYAFYLMGNHYHILAKFPQKNCAEFLRNFNARIAELVRMLVPNFGSGGLFDGKPSIQIVPTKEDILHYFLYCALQPMTSGLTENLSDYPGYNFIEDVLSNRTRSFKRFLYSEYYEAKRRLQRANPNNYWQKNTLKLRRLPGYEDMPQRDYATFINIKIRDRIQTLKKENKVGKLKRIDFAKIEPGTIPKNIKKSSRKPIVLSASNEAKQLILDWYFSLVDWYRRAAEKYRKGFFDAVFPPGTYRPPGMAICG